MMRKICKTAKNLKSKRLMKNVKTFSDSASIHSLTWKDILKKYQPHKHVRRIQIRIVKAVNKFNNWAV